MDPKSLYRIPFMGMKAGNHNFQMDVDQEFFACFPESDIQDASGVLDAVLELSETTLTLRLELNMIWRVPCGRCLEELTFPLKINEQIAIRFGEKTEISDELWIMGKNEYEIDVSQIIFEMAHLARPPHQVHKNVSDCDPSMLDYTANESEETSEKQSDPRWDALKNL